MRNWLIAPLLMMSALAITPQATNAALPGWHGIDHIGLTVPDIEQATRFLVDVIGCEPLINAGPVSVPEGDYMQRQFNVLPRSTMHHLRMLRCNYGSNVELFEWRAADQRQVFPKLSDYGGSHLSLYVDDLAAAMAYLRKHGVELLNEPLSTKEGDMAGDSIIYFKTPWGGYMELVSAPNGKGYEKNTDRRLWHPARPAE